jgi:hypothetical protein
MPQALAAIVAYAVIGRHYYPPIEIYDDKNQKQISLIFQSIGVNPCIVSPNIFPGSVIPCI